MFTNPPQSSCALRPVLYSKYTSTAGTYLRLVVLDLPQRCEKNVMLFKFTVPRVSRKCPSAIAASKHRARKMDCKACCYLGSLVAWTTSEDPRICKVYSVDELTGRIGPNSYTPLFPTRQAQLLHSPSRTSSRFISARFLHLCPHAQWRLLWAF